MTAFARSLLLGAMLVVPARAAGPAATAHLTGAAEVPDAVDTSAVGQAILQPSGDGQALHFRLVVANIEGVTQAHIHCGAANVAGPVVAFLYPDGPPPQPIPGRFSGVLNAGTLTAADVIPRPDSAECPGGVADFAELLAKIDGGEAYVNVHTQAHPAGEIRGQIR